jgi:hypothetical protein
VTREACVKLPSIEAIDEMNKVVSLMWLRLTHLTNEQDLLSSPKRVDLKNTTIVKGSMDLFYLQPAPV